MISTTFQRITYSPVQDKPSSSSSLSIIPPSSQLQNDLISPLCLSQSYDDICIVSSNTSLSLLSFPNVTFLNSLPTNKTSSSSLASTSSSTRITSRYTTTYSTSTLSYQDLNFSTSISANYTSNSTHLFKNPPLVISVRPPLSTRFRRFFNWQHIWVILVPVLCGILLCFIITILAFIKYRRKDVGVYEVEEAQRFRPLIVELTPSPGERNQENLNSTITTTSVNTSPMTNTSKTKSHKKRKRKKSPLTSANEQREFYI